MLIMYGIGKRPIQAEKIMQAKQRGGSHVNPRRLISKYPYAANTKYAIAVAIDEQM